MFLIVSKFSSELQGYYYTFNNIIALRVFVEMGLGAVIISFASHQWSKLNLNKDGRIIGDANSLSKLVSLARIVFLWYFVGGLIVLIGLSIGGYIFFSQEKAALVLSWSSPWFLLCFLTVMNMWLSPALFLLEGCNQIKRIYAYRMIQSFCINICTWTAIMLDAGLWAAAVNAAVSIICLIVFIFTKYINFFKPMISFATTSIINWRKNLWPMQWRIGLSWISGYFMSAFFTPMIFYYHGSIVAGQFGITWSLFGAIGSIADIWLVTKRPHLGMLIAKREYVILDKLFFRSAIISIGLFACGALALWLLIYFGYETNITIARRFLPPLPTGILLVGLVFTYSTAPFSYYLRAHNKEPMYWLDISTAILLAIFTLTLGKRYAALGISITYTSIKMCFSFPLAIWGWHHYRQKWHDIEYCRYSTI